MAEFLLDTNVLVYAVDANETDKRSVALRILEDAGSAAVSTQVLGEFVAVASRKLADRLGPDEAHEAARSFADSFEVLGIDRRTFLEALRGKVRHGFAYWDAQLWATARLAGVPLVLSEDFADGCAIEGVLFRNPFGAGFRLVDAIAEAAS